MFRIFLSPLISSENFSLFFSFALSSLCSLFSLCSFRSVQQHLTILFFLFSDLYSSTSPPPRPTPRPRLEGDAHPAGHAAKERTTPACRQALSCPIPAGLEVTHSADLGLDERDPPHGQACRLGLPCPIPAGLDPSVPISAWLVPAVPMTLILQRKGHQNALASPSCLFGWLLKLICLFGCCEKLIWWELVIFCGK